MPRRVGRVALLFLLLAVALIPAAGPAAGSDIECFNETCSRLSFTLSGTGGGRITTLTQVEGNPDGYIDCSWLNGKQSGSCSYAYKVDSTLGSREINFRVYADAESETCTPTCVRDRTITTQLLYEVDSPRSYEFRLVNARVVTVVKSGSGTGSVKSTPERLLCGSVCSASFSYGPEISLTATPASNSVFGGWTGPCTNAALTCSFFVATATTVGAIFELKPAPTAKPSAPPTSPPAPTARPTQRAATSAPSRTSTAPPAAPSLPEGSASGSSTEPLPGSTQDVAASDPGSSAAGTSPDLVPGATPGPSLAPVAAPDGGTDMTPIAVAIVIAAVVLAAGLAAAAYLFRRRSPDTMP